MEHGLASSGLGIDSVIQGALAAGIPIQQVLQFLQNSGPQVAAPPVNAQQQCLAAVAAANPAQLLSNANVSQSIAQATQPSLNLSFALTQPALAQLSSSQVSQPAQQTLAQSLPANTNVAESSSLPWPIFQPAVQVPHFDMSTYQKVNLDVHPSALPSGMDLPLHDMNTLRFFFNFGVHYARQILLREHFQQPGQAQSNQPNSHVQASQTTNAQQGQNQANNTLSILANQDLLYQQMLLKGNADVLNAGKPIGTPLPGSTSAVTDPRSAFHLQRDLAVSLQNHMMIKNEPIEQLLMHNQLVNSQQSRISTIPQSTPLAILQQQQQQQQQQLQQQQQQQQAQAQAQAQQHSQQQQASEANNDVLRPHAVSLNSQLSNEQSAQQQLLQQQEQLLGGISLMANQVKTAQVTQVPLDPAPRTTGSEGRDGGLVHGSVTQSGFSLSQKEVQDQADRMKPTAVVRGAVADVANRNLSPAQKPSGDNTPNRSPLTGSSASSAAQSAAAVAAANAFVSQFGGNVDGQMPSLAAQLSAAMVASTFLNPKPAPGAACTNGSTTASASSVPVTTNPDAHLLAGTSPFARFSARSLTTGQSGATSQASTSTESGHEDGQNSSIDLKPESILQTSEQHFTEAFKRLQKRPEETPGPESPEKVQRKTGLNMLNVENKETENKRKSSNEKPIPSMINYVNSCLSQLKNQVQSQGVGLPIDHNGRPIDYSSRPIDPIFRQAREKLDKDRDLYLRRGSPNQFGQAEADACPIGISDRSRSEQPQDTRQKLARLSPGPAAAAAARPRSTQPVVEADNNNADSAPKRARLD